jgi:hypothetical protein
MKIVCSVLGKKLAVIVLIALSTAGAFATLGDGKIRSDKPKASLLSNKTSVSKGSFSLKSGYSYRGSEIINTKSPKYINLNSTVTYQKGHTTYTVPLRKKVISEKITFNPNSATRNF